MRPATESAIALDVSGAFAKAACRLSAMAAAGGAPEARRAGCEETYMRLKHVFVLAPLLLFAVIAGAADTQLKEISVTAQGGATVVALETAGPFTHSEYRPQPSMVLVDLQKVSSTALKQRQRSLDSPAVKSYRVLEYKSVGGIGVTRVELTVTDAAKLQVKETKNGLQLLFTAGGSTAASQASPAAAVHSAAARRALAPKPAASAPAKPVPTYEAASPQPVTIRNIGVVRTSAGMAVEIEGAKTARTLRLSDPERLVVDIENSLSATKQRTIMVNAADLKSVRIAQFQLDSAGHARGARSYRATRIRRRQQRQQVGGHRIAAESGIVGQQHLNHTKSGGRSARTFGANKPKGQTDSPQAPWPAASGLCQPDAVGFREQLRPRCCTR